jgi:hypothetical protein
MFNSGSDPMLQALKAINYLVVRLPKADLHPLHIMSRDDKNMVRLGDISNVFKQGKFGPPTIQSGDPQANINGSRTGSMKIGLGLSVLGNIIGAMGGSKLGLDVAYKNVKSAVFEFQNVTEDKVGIDLLDKFLNDSDIDSASVAVGKLFNEDRVYVITAVLRSDTFIFDASTTTETGVTLEVPVIQQAVGGKVTVEAQNETKTKLSYKGAIPLAFAFQAIQLFFEDGQFTAFKPAQNVTLAFEPAAGARPESVDFLDFDDPFVRVKD